MAVKAAAARSSASGKRLGRPRNRPVGPDAEPREDILDAAATLFEMHGFGATTTRQIAAAAGLEQGSLFHYFSRKDQILEELLDQMLEPAVAYAGWLDKQRLPPDEKLYLLAYRDTLNICSGRHNLGMLMHLPEARRPEFDDYWQKRLALKRLYGGYVAAATRDGLFAGIDFQLGTDLAFAMVESSIEWFARGKADPARTAKEVASAVISLLVSMTNPVDGVVRRASERIESGPHLTAYVSPHRKAKSARAR
jgi:AcrR family transcriptional regulator